MVESKKEAKKIFKICEEIAALSHFAHSGSAGGNTILLKFQGSFGEDDDKNALWWL